MAIIVTDRESRLGASDGGFLLALQDDGLGRRILWIGGTTIYSCCSEARPKEMFGMKTDAWLERCVLCVG